MKQKLIIGFSLLLLISAVYLISRDLFSHSASSSASDCCGYDDASLKAIDSSQLGYTRIRYFETGFQGLSGLSVDSHNQLYVSGKSMVARFTAEGKKSGEFPIDTASGCIAVSNNRIYVGLGARIACFDTAGHLISTWKAYNSKGYLTSIATTEQFVFAADAMNKRILKYSPEGDFVMEFGKKDSLTGNPGFVIPSLYFDVTAGGFNDLWITNPGRLIVENYTLSGTRRSSWGKEEFDNSGFMGCCNPVQLALLPDGEFVTYEKGIDKVKVFDPAGRFMCLVAGAGSFRGKADFQLGKNNLVKDMTADGTGTVYILDAYNRINVFIKKQELDRGL